MWPGRRLWLDLAYTCVWMRYANTCLVCLGACRVQLGEILPAGGPPAVFFFATVRGSGQGVRRTMSRPSARGIATLNSRTFRNDDSADGGLGTKRCARPAGRRSQSSCRARRCINASLSPPAIAQLVEHLTVDACSDQMVPGSIPGGRISRRHSWR